MNPPVTLQHDGEIAFVTIDNPPVNALGRSVRDAMLRIFERLNRNATVRAVVLAGEGRCFIAGADIKEFGKPAEPPLLPDVCVAIEAMSVPVVASLHGATLGGGLEVAMAAHYRIAHPSSTVGLPEVRLGLIPGAGGTQRLPRLVGTKLALDLITKGRQITASEALEFGLIDRIDDGDPTRAGMRFARELLASSASPRPTSELPRPALLNWAKSHDAVSRRARGQIAPLKALEAVRASTELDFVPGMKAERSIFDYLMQTDQRKALIHAFFAERNVGTLPEIDGVRPRPLGTIGVIGGGTMGAGIAASALLAGFPVTLVEQTEEYSFAAMDRIAINLSGAVKRGRLSDHEAKQLLKNKLSISSNEEDLATSDLVIEAVFEDLAAKRSVFSRLDTICKPGAILATNTSYLDINEIAAVTSRPQDVLGLHFFSPAHVMKLLEVIVPERTAPNAVATSFELAKRLGKTAVRSGVCDGFIGNRILNACRTAVDHMVLDGASPFEVDAAMVAFGYPLGPFQVADLAGLDIGWAMRKRLAPKRKPHERVGRYADELCEAGHFGRKTGTGFYLYEAKVEKPEPNLSVLNRIASERAERGIVPREFGTDEIQRRYVSAMVNEAARIVEEGIARRPSDIDVVLITGYAFPRHFGGPCKWADLMGLERVLADLSTFAQNDTHFWSPAPLLEHLVLKNGVFEDLNKP